MLSAGKTMWNETVNANWMRARSKAERAEFMSVKCVMAARADYARRPLSVRTALGRWRKSRG
jgi:hypothetical protein